MLLSLRIENFALIDHLELEFGTGLNVLTGETGAGKSIILDALDAALGGKVTHRVIRAGEVRALVEATFKVTPAVAGWLSDREIDPLEDGSVVCYREIAQANGNLRSRSVHGVHSRTRINGILVNRQEIEKLRNLLVEITAQGQTIELLASARVRELLDVYGGDSVLEQRVRVAQTYATYQQAFLALETRRQSEQQRLQRLDLLKYQTRDLESANLRDADELEQLEQERQRLSHVVDLQQMSYQVYQAIYQNDEGIAAADLLGTAEATLSDIVAYDAQMQPVLDIVSTALAQVVEAGRQINAYGEDLEADPKRLGEVEERIRALKQICRKYGPTLAEALAHYHSLQAELAELIGSGESIEELETNYLQSQQALTGACAQLSHERRNAAADLERRLVGELKPLAMEKVQFKVAIAVCPPTSLGADTIAFYFSPNPGEPLQPLGAIASGGEMSRFLLALKACFSQVDAADTLIFDEIDAGVSGRVAQAIAEKLHQLSQHHQVLCVTHQPLVAAMADYHFRVDKQVIGITEPIPDLRTVVRVSMLDNHFTRREELAELAGGQSAGEALAFVESLLTQAANRRQN